MRSPNSPATGAATTCAVWFSILGLASAPSGIARAGATDIAAAPIFTSAVATTPVLPNVMFVLDDSGSMDWNHMPDIVKNFAGKYGYASSQCNGVYYNPSITYTPPVDAAGLSFVNSSFTNAWKNGYKTSAGTSDLSKSFEPTDDPNVGYDYPLTEAYYFVYSGSHLTEKQRDYTTTTGAFYKECESNIGSTPGSSVFTKKTVSSTSGPGGTDERVNFANWYSYYRTRMLMMKTASGLAFKTLDQNFRVGFMSLNNNASQAFLNISKFDSTQKASWYSKLYTSVPRDGTPLREALANAGRIYAGKVSSINGVSVTDPVQYSCQQNYTILSTDGFWNGTDSNVKKLDGTTTMDNQDGTLPRPYNDGGASTSTAVTTYTSTQNRQRVTSGAVTTKTWTKNKTTVASCTTTGTLTPPANVRTGYLDIGNERKGALGFSATDPASGYCYSLGNSAWFCRGKDNNDNPAVSLSSVTDTTGKTWYLVDDSANKTGCVSARDAFINKDYKNKDGVCPGTGSAGVSGSLVTTTPYAQIETISGGTTTTIDIYTATQTRTQVTTNGVAGVLGALTPSTLATKDWGFTSNISTSTSGTLSDVCGGQPAPCPSTSGTWTAGTANPNNTCVAGPSVPSESEPMVAKTSTSADTSAPYTVVASTGPTASTPVITATSTGGTSNTLADVAAHYYNTNLRTTALGNCAGVGVNSEVTDLCTPNRVPPNGLDTATWQHMTTFTLGLGARGRMVFSPSYLTDTTGDYYDVFKGNTASSTNCTWRDGLTVTGGACNWPIPSGANNGIPGNIDDLWHAAVNGHGNYYSATDPSTLKNGLSSSLNVIINTPQPGTAASAATTNPKITSANNFQFSSYFKSLEWSGELIKQTMSLTDGSVAAYNPLDPNPSSYVWSAQTLLNAKSYATRNIYTSGVSGLISFAWANLSATQQAYFKTPAISTSPPAYPSQLTGLSQFCTTGTDCINSTAQSNFTISSGGAAGEALVNFLRGDRSNEEGVTTDTSKFFRNRAHVLGDIVSAQPQWVGPPNKTYTDAGYAAFKTAQAGRTPVVFAAANDGMLHTFDADTGDEKWAFIPSHVLPKLYTLADKKYASKHQYFVEGTPKSGDAYIGGAWKTILVGGLNGGGAGYYALDITNPAAPVLLWEIAHANMGYSFGNPEITKLDDGTWVVLVTSGYNNCARSGSASCVTSAGEGTGYLYVLNASTGRIIRSLSTGVGGSSGLSRIIAQAGATNVSTKVYGGDLLGNLWRFNIATSGPGSYTTTLLATFKDPTGVVQPITARPQVTSYEGNSIVFVGTGRYLGTSDVGTSQQQSFYGVKDNVVSTAYTAIRSDSSIIKKTAVDGICPTGTAIEICDPGTQVRTVSLNTGTSATDSITTKNGWFVDFPASAHELSFTDPKLVLGTLAFSTSVPVASTSSVCGDPTYAELPAFAYTLDYLTGGSVGNTTVIASTLGVGIATSPQTAQLPDGKIIDKYRLSSGQEVTKAHRFAVGAGVNRTRRVSWREMVSQ
ncbi:MAG: hypothetical protein K9J77_00105 [Rhodoferax sp.]|nr:hypothetical protein [Rhodoferax sp.]